MRRSSRTCKNSFSPRKPRGARIFYDAEPRYYFHCTQSYEIRRRVLVSLHALMYPRTYGNNRPYYEPRVARICVCPTISGCLAASYLNNDPIVVLRTDRKVSAWTPFGVKDAHLTEERWLLALTRFEAVAWFDRSEVDFRDNFSLKHMGEAGKAVKFNKRALENVEKLSHLQEFF